MPENDAPEAVQAMSSGSNWVYPDLVRVQSSNNTIDVAQNGNISVNADVVQQPVQALDANNITSSRNNNYSVNGGAIPRTSQRILDPPDVSLSSSSSIGSTGNQHNIDLCNSTRVNSKLSFQSSLCNLRNNVSYTASSHNISSPNSNSSSSSSASSLSTNLSGLILSNTSSCSSQQNLESRSNDLNTNVNSNGIIENNYLDFNNLTTSTSSNFLPTSTFISNQRVTNLEREIRTLEMQKSLLQQQLMQKDCQINDLQRTLSTVSNTTQNVEETVIRRINDSFERLNTNIENTMSIFERRIEHLENSFKSSVFDLPNGSNRSNINDLKSDTSNDSTSPLVQTIIDLQNKVIFAIY